MSTDIRLIRWPDRDAGSLQRLGDALRQISSVVAASRTQSPEPIVTHAPAFPELPSEVEKARTLLQQCRRRSASFGTLGLSLFAEPAWDMLLDLFIAHEEGQLRSMADFACSAVRLRWVAALVSDGLVRRWHDDVQDAEVVSLTPDAVTLMLGYLDGV